MFLPLFGELKTESVIYGFILCPRLTEKILITSLRVRVPLCPVYESFRSQRLTKLHAFDPCGLCQVDKGRGKGPYWIDWSSRHSTFMRPLFQAHGNHQSILTTLYVARKMWNSC